MVTSSVACFLIIAIISKTCRCLLTVEPLKEFLLCSICPKISAWLTPSVHPGLCSERPSLTILSKLRHLLPSLSIHLHDFIYPHNACCLLAFIHMLTCLLSSFSESSIRAGSIQAAFPEHVTLQSKPQVQRSWGANDHVTCWKSRKKASVARERVLGDEAREAGRGQIMKAFVDHGKWFGFNSEYNG